MRLLKESVYGYPDMDEVELSDIVRELKEHHGAEEAWVCKAPDTYYPCQETNRKVHGVMSAELGCGTYVVVRLRDEKG